MSDPIHQQNARAWDRLAIENAKLAQPARDTDFANPLQTVDPLGWLGKSIAGQNVLCLAAGGGRQSALYAAAGANVTVVDISPEMLAQDRAVAAERGYAMRVLEGSMDDLSIPAAGEFDLVIHPVSSCYLPDVTKIYAAVARVLRPGGLYVSQHKSPMSLQTSLKPAAGKYTINETYYRTDPVPPATQPTRLREPGTVEFLHRWEQLIGGLCRAGFVIEDLIEPMHAEQGCEPGSFGHRGQYVAPYVRIKARRVGAAAAKIALA